MNVKAMTKPKFKVGDTVYYYDCFLEDVIKKDEVERIEYVDDTFWYHLKNQQFCHRKKELFKTFEECKADCISRYEAMILNLQIASKYQSIMMILETHKKMLEKIKGQVEAL